MLYDRVGRVALRFSVAYVRRRYRFQIRLGAAGALAVLAAVAAYLVSRDVPEG